MSRTPTAERLKLSSMIMKFKSLPDTSLPPFRKENLQPKVEKLILDVREHNLFPLPKKGVWSALAGAQDNNQATIRLGYSTHHRPKGLGQGTKEIVRQCSTLPPLPPTAAISRQLYAACVLKAIKYSSDAC